MPTSICSSQDHDPLPGRVKISSLRFLPLHPFLYHPPQPPCSLPPPSLHFPFLFPFIPPCSLLLHVWRSVLFKQPGLAVLSWLRKWCGGVQVSLLAAQLQQNAQEDYRVYHRIAAAARRGVSH